SNPSDLAPLLAITGQLEPVFGSRKRFMSRYTRSYTINVGGREIEKTVPRRENLAELSGLLSEQVWVRRGKDQVLGDLPEKRSEEHTSELQSRFDLVCRLLLEEKN